MLRLAPVRETRRCQGDAVGECRERVMEDVNKKKWGMKSIYV